MKVVSSTAIGRVGVWLAWLAIQLSCVTGLGVTVPNSGRVSADARAARPAHARVNVALLRADADGCA